MFFSGAGLFRVPAQLLQDAIVELLRGVRLSTLLRALGPGVLFGLLVFGAGTPVTISVLSGLSMIAFVLISAAAWRALRARRRQGDEVERLRKARRETAVRRLWRAGGDFVAGAWGRGDLETLRLLSLNIQRGQPLSDRVAGRFRAAISSILAGALDRLSEVAAAAREAQLSLETCDRLDRGLAVLVSYLEQARCHAGEPAVLESRGVAEAISTILAACDDLREELRPRIAADTVPMLRWIIRAKHALRWEAGGILLEDAESAADSPRVAVRPLDLARALESLLETIFHKGQLAGRLEILQQLEPGELTLRFAWPVRDRWHLEPSALFEPLRPLTFYGARFEIGEQLDVGRAHVDLVLPRVTLSDDMSQQRPPMRGAM